MTSTLTIMQKKSKINKALSLLFINLMILFKILEFQPVAP